MDDSKKVLDVVVAALENFAIAHISGPHKTNESLDALMAEAAKDGHVDLTELTYSKTWVGKLRFFFRRILYCLPREQAERHLSLLLELINPPGSWSYFKSLFVQESLKAKFLSVCAPVNAALWGSDQPVLDVLPLLLAYPHQLAASARGAAVSATLALFCVTGCGSAQVRGVYQGPADSSLRSGAAVLVYRQQRGAGHMAVRLRVSGSDSRPLFVWLLLNPAVRSVFYSCVSDDDGSLPPHCGWQRGSGGELPAPRVTLPPSRGSGPAPAEAKAAVTASRTLRPEAFQAIVGTGGTGVLGPAGRRLPGASRGRVRRVVPIEAAPPPCAPTPYAAPCTSASRFAAGVSPLMCESLPTPRSLLLLLPAFDALLHSQSHSNSALNWHAEQRAQLQTQVEGLCPMSYVLCHMSLFSRIIQ
jgi:hypothetical protein